MPNPNNIKLNGLLLDSRDDFWFGAWGLNHYDEKTHTITSYVIDRNYPSYRVEDWPHSQRNDVYALFQAPDRSNEIWVASRGGLYRFDRVAHRFEVFHPYPENFGESVTNTIAQHVTAVHQDRNGTFWVGARRGLLIFDQVHRRFSSFEPLLRPEGIFGIYEDRRGAIWITSEVGLSKITPPAYPFTVLHDPDDSLSVFADAAIIKSTTAGIPGRAQHRYLGWNS